jgi:hypothetical protein
MPPKPPKGTAMWALNVYAPKQIQKGVNFANQLHKAVKTVERRRKRFR